MVLILLSSPNPMSPLTQSPRSKDVSPLSPRTPLTPSPSFFAILSPIFTADDNGPPSPLPRQLSPGTIPPETPPPWLLAPPSPASPLRPVAVRQPSTDARRQFSLPRLTTGEGLTNSPRSAARPQRPGLPSITHSFTSGSPQQFRPPPLGSMKRMNTAPVHQLKQPKSPLQRGWRAVSEPVKAQAEAAALEKAQPPKLGRAVTNGPVPQLSVRPPSRELEEAKKEGSEDDTLEDEEARRLSVAVMGVDSGLGSGFEGTTGAEEESMEVPFAIEVEEPTPTSPNPTADRQSSARPRPATLTKPVPRSVTELRGPFHSRSQSLEAGSPPRSKPKPIQTHITNPITLTPSPRTPREQKGMGTLGKLAVAAAQQS